MGEYILVHSGTGKIVKFVDRVKKNFKYYKKENINGKVRYFYSSQEYDAWNKNKGRISDAKNFLTGKASLYGKVNADKKYRENRYQMNQLSAKERNLRPAETFGRKQYASYSRDLDKAKDELDKAEKIVKYITPVGEREFTNRTEAAKKVATIGDMKNKAAEEYTKASSDIRGYENERHRAYDRLIEAQNLGEYHVANYYNKSLAGFADQTRLLGKSIIDALKGKEHK